MERSRLLHCLAADYMRLRDVAGTGLTVPVPSCPGWTVTDLVRHVGLVYLHKATVMQTGAWPDPWPPSETATEDPIALLDRGYGAVTHEFSRRGDADQALTWHARDQTVKFWIRRMAQETVIHRLDAELALQNDSAPIPTDLAVDGIDEVLRLFVDYGSRAWHEDFADALSTAKGRTVLIRTTPPGSVPAQGPATSAPASTPAAGPATSPSGARTSAGAARTPAPPASTFGHGASAPALAAPAWLIRTDQDGATVTAATPTALSIDLSTPPDAVVTGDPAALLRWLWARESSSTTDVHQPIQVEGDEEALKELRALLVASTQ
jgi:uncharacterized protein (TIGR03083 family)